MICDVHMQVASATNRMTVKTEAGVAASLGIIRVSIKSLSKNTLADCSLVSVLWLSRL